MSLLDMDLAVGGDDWSPTPHGIFMAETLAEHNVVAGKDVLELGAGSANHTIVIQRQGAKSIVATEVTEPFLDTTRRNVELNCPDATNVSYRVADWLDTEGEFDVIVSNPPFCKSGKQNRRYYIDSLILDGHRRLRSGGQLLFVQSSMADVAKTERRLAGNGFDARVLAQRSGAFRDYYFEDESFMVEIRDVPNGYETRDGTFYETLFVILATLRPWHPPRGAHLPSS